MKKIVSLFIVFMFGFTVGFAQTINADKLYQIRHHTYTYESIGTRRTGGIKIFNYRYIYCDNGMIIHGYIVDLNGNIRSDVGYSTGSIDEMFPICEYYSIPKYIRDLAKKSLE